MAFNPILQSQIQPVQTAVQPNSTSFAAGALGTALNFGEAILAQGQRESIFQAKQAEAQQKALVTERVSSAALPLADLFANAGSGKGVRIAQQTREYEAKLIEQGYSATEIVEIFKTANAASGTNYSSAIKVERSEEADAMRAQDQFLEKYFAVAPWVPREYLTEDNKLPVDGPEAIAAFRAATLAKAQNEARREEALTRSAVSNANMNQAQELSRFTSEALSTQITNNIIQKIGDYDFNTNEGKQKALQALAEFRVTLPATINSVQDMTRQDKDAFLSGMGTVLTAFEDNITGKTMADIGAKQMGAWLQTAKDIALSENNSLLQAFIYSGLGIQVQQTDVMVLNQSTLEKILSANPNSASISTSIQDSTLTDDQKLDKARDIFMNLNLPTKPVTDPNMVEFYTQNLAQVLAAPLRADQKELLAPNGMYNKITRALMVKQNADNLGAGVLGNEEFQQNFTLSSSRAISTYVPLAMNTAIGNMTPSMKDAFFGDGNVKEITQISTKSGYVQVKLPAIRDLSRNERISSSEAKYLSANASLNKLNEIFRNQYEAAVQIDRVSGSNLAEEIRNTQLQTVMQFMQVQGEAKGKPFSQL
jgi:hypothetical protein